MRRILFLLVIIVILLGVAYTLFNLEKQQDAHRSAYEALPRNAALILDLKDPLESIRDIVEKNLIWEEFSESELFGEIKNLIQFSDSSKAINDLLDQNRVIVFALANDTGLSWSYVIPIPISFDQEKSINTIQNIKNLTWDAESASGEFVLNNRSFSAKFREGLLLLSASSSALSSMEQSLDANTGLQSDQDFAYAYQVGGKNKTLNFYFQHHELENWLLDKLRPDVALALSKFSQMGKWTELDLLLKPNSVQLNGFSVGQVQLPYSSEQSLEKYFPYFASKTGYYYSTGLLDFSYDQKEQALIDSLAKNSYPGFEEKLSSLKKKNGFVFGKKSMLDSTVSSFALFPKEATDVLDELLNSYNIYDTIVQFPSLFAKALGIEFESGILFHRSLEDFHLFAGSKEDLEAYYYLSKNLQESKNFKGFNENLLNSSSFSTYISPYRMQSEIGGLFIDKFKGFWTDQSSLLERFEGVSWQFTKESNTRVFHHIYLKYNPHFQEDQDYLWLVKGDAKFRKKIYPFTNHYTGATELLVQDENDRLHLYNSKGKKLWEKKIDGAINSEVYVVDRYKNKKYQMLFSTENKIYLIDRKGRDTENYPFKIANGLSCGIACLDYAGSTKYRILACTQKGKITNYDINGKTVKGWNYKQKSPVLSTPRYFKIGKLDHILIHTKDDGVFTINRRGEKRLAIETKERIKEESFGLFPGSNEKKTLIAYLADSNLVVHGLKSKPVGLRSLGMNSAVEYLDLDQDKYPEILVQSDTTISAFEFRGDLLFEFSDQAIATNSIQGVSNDIYSYGLEGLLKFRSNSKALKTEVRIPSTDILIRDINADQKQELIYVGADGHLYCIRFEYTD